MAPLAGDIVLDRVRFADDVDWLPPGERARVAAPSASLRALAVSAWFVAAATSVLISGYIPPSRRRRGRQGAIRQRMLRSALRRWLGRRATRVRHFADLDNVADGTLVAIRGRVCGPADAVFEQIAFTVKTGSEHHPKVYHLVRETAVDFDIADQRGDLLRLQVADSRLIGPVIDEEPCLVDDLPPVALDEWPSVLEREVRLFRDPAMGTYRLGAGGSVEVYGTKDRVVDRSIRSRLHRDDPVRASLRSGHDGPLIILAG